MASQPGGKQFTVTQSASYPHCAQQGDLVRHAGHWPLHYTYLREGKFDGHVVILDPHSADLAGSENPLKQFAREIYYHIR